MNATTRLEPLDTQRAQQIQSALRTAQKQPEKALALNGEGTVTGVVDATDHHEAHLLFDLDVHA